MYDLISRYFVLIENKKELRQKQAAHKKVIYYISEHIRKINEIYRWQFRSSLSTHRVLKS